MPKIEFSHQLPITPAEVVRPYLALTKGHAYAGIALEYPCGGPYIMTIF